MKLFRDVMPTFMSIFVSTKIGCAQWLFIALQCLCRNAQGRVSAQVLL